MLRILIILCIPGLLLWSVYVWWQAKRAHSLREKSFFARASMAVWLLTGLFLVALCMAPQKIQVLLLGVAVFAGLGVRRLWRLVLARIRVEEADPFIRAKRIN